MTSNEAAVGRMNISQGTRVTKDRFIAPGRVAIASGPLATIVSSGIAACLWDPVAELGGMAHFVMPEGVSGNRCCRPALDHLLDELLRLGAQRARLAARLYGGCRTRIVGPTSGRCLGEKNQRAAENWLIEHGIAVAGGECGGQGALRVLFSPLKGQGSAEPVTPAGEKPA